MKLKRQPEDFQVEELPIVSGSDRGRFTLYRLTKRGLGTLEAVEAIRRRWNLSARQISYGGLKDRHALTIQYITIFEGPQRSLHESSFDLEPVGRIGAPYGPNQFRGNRFVVVLRDLTQPAVDRAVRAIGEIPTDGLPNYFDDQRFGSVGFDGDFIARAWLAGDYERALYLVLAAPNPSDRPRTKAEKEILRDCWTRWPDAKARLDRSHARSIVTYLADHPDDFRGAFARVKRELRSLYFSAFQSHVWNAILGRWIEHNTRPEQRIDVEFKLGALPVQRGLDREQATTLKESRIPLPSSRNPQPEGPLGDAIAEVLAPFKLNWTDFRVKHLKDVFFSMGSRPALFFPERLGHEVRDDEFARSRHCVRLTFELPKGAYATLVVKRITDAAQ